MNDFKNTIYRVLIDRENFYMKQYYSKFHRCNCFIAIKELPQGIYCVIVTDEKYEEVDMLESIEYIKTLGKPFSLNSIILSSGEYISLDSHSINKIVINKNNFDVLSCDEACIPLRQILEQIPQKDEVRSKNVVNEKMITLILMGINIIMFLITAFLSNDIFDIDTRVLVFFGAKYNPLIYRGEIWRLLTCAFLHSGVIHIVFNMYALYIIGPQIQQIYGRIKYLIIYISSCITASLLGVITSPNIISVGASGGIFGLMGALLAFAIVERNRIEKKYISSLIKVIAINLMIGLALSNIDNFGHIGGFLGGGLLGYFIYKLQNISIMKKY